MTSRLLTPMFALLLAAALVTDAGTATAATTSTAQAHAAHGHRAKPTCALGPRRSVKHVIYIQFDNVHLTRDNPRVPSDLEQMPNLLNFIRGNGTMVSHEHTPLIAHTADDIVTSETGLYGNHQGMPIANEYHYYVPGGSSDEAGSFAYWTDPIVDYYTGLAAKPIGDSKPTMVGANGKNAPAPWVPYTRAGCDFGSVAAANTELENTLPDVPHVFGAHSAQAREAERSNKSGSDQARAEADFMGMSVHCARGSHVCGRHGSVPDRLTAEPGGYRGFRALFGSKFIQPVISPAGPVRNLNGQVIKDSFGQAGFPGYEGMTGPNSLAYTLDMQLHGIPVTFTYLSDLHDSSVTGKPFGPGQAGYEAQLRAENRAFGEFFSRLAAHGITKANTLFVITADEGDHFVGSKPSPANCNGIRITCHYSRIGEVNVNLSGLLADHGVKTAFDVQADSAPVIYVHHQPGRSAPSVRKLAEVMAQLRGVDLASGAVGVKLTDFLADPVELKILHMITGDPKRTPSLVAFGNTEFWQNGSSSSCAGKACFTEPAGTDAWNHGTVSPQINTTWLGLVGPGVAHIGKDNAVWSDHTDIQPTMMSLLRLRDDYVPDGQVLSSIMTKAAIPAAMKSHRAELLKLAGLYSQIWAPLGEFGMLTLKASTTALSSTSPAVYNRTEKALARLSTQRNALAAKMRTLLLGAAFHGVPINPIEAGRLLHLGNKLIDRARRLN